MSRFLAIANQKGGVGKTTTTLNLGFALAIFEGKKVLLVDLDPQGNLTSTVFTEGDKESKSAFDLMEEAALTESYLEVPDGYERMTAKDVCHRIKECEKGYVDIIPANSKLEDASVKLASIAGREFLLNDALEHIAKEYDVVIFDCPATFELLTLNAFCTGADIYVPVECEGFAIKGFVKMVKKIQHLRRMSPNLKLKGILATKYEKNEGLAKKVRLLLRKHFPTLLMDVKIHRNIKIKESPTAKASIFDYAPTSSGADDYKHLGRLVAQGL